MFWREQPDGVQVLVNVQPRSRRPGVGGMAPAVSGTRLRIGVSEPAEDGRANRAACQALAAALGVPPNAIGVTSGASSRQKTMSVRGDPAVLAMRLAAMRNVGGESLE